MLLLQTRVSSTLYDPSSDSSNNGLNYNNPFTGCSVQLIEVAQYLWSPVTDQVRVTGETEKLMIEGMDLLQHVFSGVPSPFDISQRWRARW